jgi:hypothetical protein
VKLGSTHIFVLPWGSTTTLQSSETRIAACLIGKDDIHVPVPVARIEGIETYKLHLVTIVATAGLRPVVLVSTGATASPRMKAPPPST